MFKNSVDVFRKSCPPHGILLAIRGIKRILPPDPAVADALPVMEFPAKRTNRNILYAWGLGEHGALGHFTRKKKLSRNSNHFRSYNRPLKLNFSEMRTVRDVAAGFGFSLIAVRAKKLAKVYGTGLNTDSQLGLQLHSKDSVLDVLVAPGPIRIAFSNNRTTNVIGLAAGRAHSVVVTDNEGIFTFGNNAYGQCGRTIIKDEKYQGSAVVHNIKNLDGLRIMSAECGQDHTLLLMEDGSVYSCGWSADGQTGLGHMRNEGNFTRVKGDIEGEKIVKISSAADCVLALNDKGEVFGWGNSEYCQICPESSQQQQMITPMRMKKCDGFGKIVDVAAGGAMCMILNEAGEVFTWGFGILGRGQQASLSWKPELIPPILFGRNEFETDLKVMQIYCGLNHCAAVTNKGDLYTWGKNKGGCLGLGKLDDQFFPLRVALGTFCLKVSLGVDHTLALCRMF